MSDTSPSLSPAECYQEALKHLALADSVWEPNTLEQDFLPRYNALVATANVYARLANVAPRAVGFQEQEEEDLRP
jgi:hypothetical protein